MSEFYRPREPQLALLPVDLNKVLQQVIDLTHGIAPSSLAAEHTALNRAAWSN
jgi:hypothetical protein